MKKRSYKRNIHWQSIDGAPVCAYSWWRLLLFKIFGYSISAVKEAVTCPRCNDILFRRYLWTEWFSANE